MPDEISQAGSDAHVFASGAFLTIGGRILGRLLDLVSQVILARFLGPALYGLYAIGYALQRIVGWFSTLGLEQGVLHFGSPYWGMDRQKLRAVIAQTFSLAILTGGSLWGIFLLFSPVIASDFYGNIELTGVIRWFSLALPLVAGVRVAAAATRISSKMSLAVLIEDLTQPVGNLLMILISLMIGSLFWGSIYAYALSFGIAFILSVYCLRRIYHLSFSDSRKSPVTIKVLTTFSFPASLSGVFITLIVWVDRFAVGLLMPTYDAGIYQSASQISLLFAILMSAIGTIFAPLLAALVYSENPERIQELYKISMKWGFFLAIPAFSMIALYPMEIMETLYGASYSGGATILVILTIGQLFNAAAGPVGPMLVLTGHQTHWFRTTTVFLLLDLILNVTFISIYGTAGAALATSIVIFGVFCVGILQIRNLLQFNPFDRRFLKGSIILLFTLGFLYITKSFISIDNTILDLVFAGVMVMIAFGFLFRILGWESEDQEILDLIRQRYLQRSKPS
jgi:O-antigen/teichoic acid export membrane protein